jgi:GT2 family glycosyltransferase
MPLAEIERLGVVILTYGRDGVHEPLVEELLTRDGLPPEALLVVHNPFGPEDTWVPSVPDGVSVMRMPDNAGFAGGMNAGAKAHGDRGRDRVLLLTHDVRLAEGAVVALWDAMRSNGGFAVLGPVLRLPDGGMWSTGVVRTRYGVRHSHESVGESPIVQRDAVDGSVMLVRNDVLAGVGGFEDRFFMYWEETEFCLRCSQAGWRVGVVGSASALTQPGTAKRHAVHAYLITRNGLEYARRAGGIGSIAWRLAETIRMLAILIPRPGGPRFRQRNEWRVAGLRWLGSLYGIVHFTKRRWGRPPALLTRWSDMR